MGTNQPLAFNEERQLHVDIMRAIARELHDIPMVLKGGTALCFVMGLIGFRKILTLMRPKNSTLQGELKKSSRKKPKGTASAQ